MYQRFVLDLCTLGRGGFQFLKAKISRSFPSSVRITEPIQWLRFHSAREITLLGSLEALGIKHPFPTALGSLNPGLSLKSFGHDG